MARAEGEGKFSDAPGHRQNDVVGTRMLHTSDRVGVRITLAQLEKTGKLLYFMSIIPSKGEAQDVMLAASKGSWSGELRDPETGDVVACGKHAIDYKADVVSMSLPKDCVGKGRWVRFRVGTYSSEGKSTYLDDALRDRPLEDSDKNWSRSARIYK